MKKKGLFITFEGIDGCGKTTQLKLAEKYLKSIDLTPLVIREPGSTPVSEKIRIILLDGQNDIGPVSELLLYIAARVELVRQVIYPALKENKIILCDRFYDSTLAYQGYGRGIDISFIKRVNNTAIENLKPDLTFLIDIEYKTFLNRRVAIDLFGKPYVAKNEKGQLDRMDSISSNSMEFPDRVRKGFLEIAKNNRKRIKIINGNQSVEKVFEGIEHWLRRKLKTS